MKYIILAFFGLALAFASCKKEGCTDLDASNFDGKAKKDDGSCTYEVAPVVIDTICDGVQSDNTYWPLYSGLFKRYENELYGLNPVYYDVTEQVLGQVNIGGVFWYNVRVTSYLIPGAPSESIQNLRKDPINGNLYRKDGTSEVLVMPGTPQLGQELENEYFVTDLNATKSTGECSYTGCLKATKTEGLDVQILWFKRGLGQVAYEGVLGESELTEIYD